MKTFEIVVEEAICRGTGNRREVALTFDTQEHLVAELLTVKDVVEHFDHDELLDAIGSYKAKAYFGLVDEDAL
jgi:hypothetical protein